MNDVYLVIMSYCAVILIGVGVMNWLSGGFIIHFARVKMSRGRLVLLRIHGISGDYFRPGEIIEAWLIFKDRAKQQRRICCSNKEFIRYAMGVKTIDVDDEKNALLMPDFSGVAGFDAVKHENLYVRALTAPHLEDKMIKIVLIVVIILALLVVVNIFLTYKLGAKIEALNQIRTVAQNVI
jgi:hypothetical protein